MKLLSWTIFILTIINGIIALIRMPKEPLCNRDLQMLWTGISLALFAWAICMILIYGRNFIENYFERDKLDNLFNSEKL